MECSPPRWRLRMVSCFMWLLRDYRRRGMARRFFLSTQQFAPENGWRWAGWRLDPAWLKLVLPPLMQLSLVEWQPQKTALWKIWNCLKVVSKSFTDADTLRWRMWDSHGFTQCHLHPLKNHPHSITIFMGAMNPIPTTIPSHGRFLMVSGSQGFMMTMASPCNPLKLLRLDPSFLARSNCWPSSRCQEAKWLDDQPTIATYMILGYIY